MKRFSAHLMAVGLAVGLLALGSLNAPARTTVHSSAQIDSCSYTTTPQDSIYACAGRVNGNTVIVKISNARALAGVEFSILATGLDRVLLDAARISDIRAQMDHIAAGTVNILKTWLNIHTCQVEATAPGGISSIALCSSSA
jgi:hypothetical protein